jgi:CO/xanthine dehydrogenase Mo-binding subunit/aerobic-type carbon monoxide dehydrogenase small subunit (CoxS/CutS family)
MPQVSGIVVNGVERDVPLEPDRSLLHVLREELDLTGAKYGCGEGECGACTVLLDGEPVRACVTSIGEVGDRPITTIEGLAGDDRTAGGALHAVARAFLEAGAMQCGYCTPGMVVAATALLAETPRPDEATIAETLDGNLCRCGAYPRIVRAVRRASELMDEGSAPTRAGGSPIGGDLPRPSTPWDLTPVEERGHFDLLPDGLVVVLDPAGSGDEGSWSTTRDAWIHLGVDGRVIAFTGKVDVGQDNRTALRLLVAAELRVPLDSVRLVMGDTDVCPFDMGTFGSRSMPDAATVLRAAAAAAREVLAAGAPVPGERRVEVVPAPDPKAMPPLPAVTDAGERGDVGTVTGARRFPSDLTRPGIRHGWILRPPAFGATLRSLYVRDAEALPGITVVRDGGFVGVVASDPGAAGRALRAIRAEWDPAPPQPSEADLVEHLRSHPVEAEGWEGTFRDEVGDVVRALGEADLMLERTYTTAYIAHVPLETRVALAEWDGDRLTVWTGTQRPFGVRWEVAAALGVPESAVRVIVPDAGGGYGGKHSGEVAIEAARLARAAGAPVKVRWSREEEFTWAYFRPAAVIDVRSGVRDGVLTAWEFTNLNSGAAGIGSPYGIANRRIVHQPAASPLRQGSYRALAATANHFARESHVDEVAHELGEDPLAFRVRHLADERLVGVLEAAAERAGWGSGEPSPGSALGIACGVEKDAYVATCAEVRVDADGRLRVLRIVTAFDCGAIVDPDNLVNQIEGATVMGLGGALTERIRFEGGRISNPRLSEYRVPRFTDVPPIEVVLLDRPDVPPAGAGETPIVAVAPALANAIFAACGVRLRSMPLAPDGIVR